MQKCPKFRTMENYYNNDTLVFGISISEFCFKLHIIFKSQYCVKLYETQDN